MSRAEWFERWARLLTDSNGKLEPYAYLVGVVSEIVSGDNGRSNAERVRDARDVFAVFKRLREDECSARDERLSHGHCDCDYEGAHAFVESGPGQEPYTIKGCIVCPACYQPKGAPIHTKAVPR